MVAQIEENKSTSKYIAKNIPLEKIIALYAKGMNMTEIGKVLGCSTAAISIRLKGHTEDLNALIPFKDSRADTLAFYQRKLLNSIDKGAIEKCSAYQRVGMFGILYDKERLERGESTQNIAYASMDKTFRAMVEEQAKLEAELGLDRDELVEMIESKQGQDDDSTKHYEAKDNKV
jgi:DNA-directed RNA polymerase specialized sigma subunit